MDLNEADLEPSGNFNTEQDTGSLVSATTPTPPIYAVFFDGAARSNGDRGESSFAACAFAVFPERVRFVSASSGLIEEGTNVAAEWRGAEEAVRLALQLPSAEFASLIFIGDNLDVINEMRGKQARSTGHFHSKRFIRDSLQWFRSQVARHVPRSLNKIADRLANKRIDEPHISAQSQGEKLPQEWLTEARSTVQAVLSRRPSSGDPHKCPICEHTAATITKLADHIRKKHRPEELTPTMLLELRLGKCEHCAYAYVSIAQHTKSCRAKQKERTPTFNARGGFLIPDSDLQKLSNNLKGATAGKDECYKELFQPTQEWLAKQKEGGATDKTNGSARIPGSGPGHPASATKGTAAVNGPVTRAIHGQTSQDMDGDDNPPAVMTHPISAAMSELEKGSVARATKCLTSKGIADDSPEVRKKLQQLHPERLSPFGQSVMLPEVSTNPSEVKKQVQAMRVISGPGPSGMTVKSLKQLISKDEGLVALTGFVNIIIQGRAKKEYRDLITGSRLIPLRKEGDGVRPVAIGEVIARLASKVLNAQHKKDLAEYFAGLQFGVNAPGGAEQVVHALRRHRSQGHAILSLDMKNAFNCISREQIRRELTNHFPKLIPYYEWAREGDAPCFFRGEVLLHSKEGTRQGDPLSSAFFAIGIQRTLQMLQAQHPDTKVYAYLDDIYVAGKLEHTNQAGLGLREMVGDLGLTFNISKSVICIPHGTDPRLTQGMQWSATAEGIEVLGAPVGDAAYEDAICMNKIREIRNLITVQTEETIPLQYRYLLLRLTCIPTLNYLLRTVPYRSRITATQAFADTTTEVACMLLGLDSRERNLPTGEKALQQAALPLRFGGLGLTLATDISVLAYTASIWESGSALEDDLISDAVCCLREARIDIESGWLEEPVKSKKQQQIFATQRMDGLFRDLLEALPIDAKSRLQAASQVGAADWLIALPTNPRKQLSDAEWRMMARLRLGLAVSPLPIPDVCRLCSKHTQGSIDHAFTCSHGELASRRVDRHNAIRDSIAGSLTYWGMSAKTEQKINTSMKKRSDVEILQPEGICAVDVSVIHPSPLLHQQYIKPTYATLVREREKINKYLALAKEAEKIFIPFVYQTYGGMGSKALDFLKELYDRPSNLRVTDPTLFVRELRLRLSCLVQRRNCGMLRRWLILAMPTSTRSVAGSP